MELDLALRLPLELSVDEFLDLAVGVPADDDFAFALFHESDGEESPRSVAMEIAVDANKPSESPAPTSEEPSVSAAEESITFAEKTYYMINTSATRAMCWNATGTGFLIVDTELFSREVLPEFFKHRNLAKFVAELTLHGFRKSTLRHKKLATECMEFRHPYFVRGGVEQLAKIERRVAAPVPASPRLLVEDDQEDQSGENVGDLKFQISELQGEVQQTQDLFDKLLVSLMHQQQHQQQSPPTSPMPGLHMPPPFMACPPGYFNHFGMVPVPHGFFAPMAFGSSPRMHPMDPRVAALQARDPEGQLLEGLFPTL